MASYDYQLKFVIAHEGDVDEARAVALEVGAPACKVILMPEGITAETLDRRGVWIAEVCKQYGFRFSPRLHIHLYGNKRGI
jgi:7-carboxy-7-deazaguanine synthase